MSQPLSAILLYVVAISAITFVIFGIDKLKARLSHRRISERTLFNLCLLGGTPGGGLAMIMFRHKISKASFRRTYFVILILQIAVVGGGLWIARSR